MKYQVFKVGRGTNAPKKRIRDCEFCGRAITDFRVEIIKDGKKAYSCVHCPIQAHLRLNNDATWKAKVARWMMPDILVSKPPVSFVMEKDAERQDHTDTVPMDSHD